MSLEKIYFVVRFVRPFLKICCYLFFKFSMKKIFLFVLICFRVANAQVSIGSFSVIENTTNGVPTTSTTSKFDLYTDRIVIYDKNTVNFPIEDFSVTPLKKGSEYSFRFNHATCILYIYDSDIYELTINTRKKTETFKGYRTFLNSSDYFSSSNPLEGIAIQDCVINDYSNTKRLTGDELTRTLAEEITPYKDPHPYYNKEYSLSDYSEEERKFLDLGYTFPPGTDLGTMRANEQAKSDRYITYVAFTIIVLGLIVGLIFIIRNKNQSLTKKDSNIKSINEEVLKNNLIANNLENANVTEIDNDTLKQKLGL